jgi:hypothetical protein
MCQDFGIKGIVRKRHFPGALLRVQIPVTPAAMNSSPTIMMKMTLTLTLTT